MAQDGIFSDAYWNMHRNSLFFSAVCLIYSLPGVNVAKNIGFLGIENLNTRAVATLTLLALLAALCSFVIFLLEWREQAWPTWKRRYLTFRPIWKFDQGYLRGVERSLLSLEEKFRERNKILDDVKEKIDGRSFGEIFDVGAVDNHGDLAAILHNFEWFSADFIRRNYESMGSMQASELHAQLTTLMESYRRELVDHLKNYGEQLELKNLQILSISLSNELFQIQENISYLKKNFSKQIIIFILSAYKFEFSRKFVIDTMRLIIVGILIPFALIVTAVFHYIGKFSHVHMFKSWLV
jgi:hypothetical protein